MAELTDDELTRFEAFWGSAEPPKWHSTVKRAKMPELDYAGMGRKVVHDLIAEVRRLRKLVDDLNRRDEERLP